MNEGGPRELRDPRGKMFWELKLLAEAIGQRPEIEGHPQLWPLHLRPSRQSAATCNGGVLSGLDVEAVAGCRTALHDVKFPPTSAGTYPVPGTIHAPSHQ